MQKSRLQPHTSYNTTPQRAITLSPAPEVTTVYWCSAILSPTPVSKFLVVIRLHHLRHFLSAAVNGDLGAALGQHSKKRLAMTRTTAYRQCSYVRCRIRDNVKAALSEDWDSLQKWVRPKLAVDASNEELVATLKHQEAVGERIEAARLSADPVKRAHIIKALRNEFPKIASQVPEPKPEPHPIPKQEPKQEAGKEAKQTPAPAPELPKENQKAVTSFSVPPSYETATNMAQPKLPNLPTVVEPPAPSTIRRPPPAPIDERPIKRAKQGANDADDDEIADEETNSKDGDFDPAQERGERAAARREHKQRTEDPVLRPKNDVTEEQLLRQNAELQTKFRLDQIQIFKQIAMLKNDHQKQWELAEEELDLKHRRDKEKMRKKILGD